MSQEMIQRNLLAGHVYALAASPNFAQDGICFAALESGLCRSEDGGLTWQSAYESLQVDEPLLTTTVAVSPDFPTDHTVFAAVQGGILRSGDGGNTWNGTALSSPPPVISALAVSPRYADDGTLLAATVDDGVFRSSDRGKHWQPANFGLLELQTLSLAISPDFEQDATVFLGVDHGIYRSTNGGRAWRDLEAPDDLAAVLSLALSPTFTRDSIVFAGTESNGLWISRDRGQTWNRLEEAGDSPFEGPINTIAVAAGSDLGMDVLLMLNQSLLISRDSGQSWSAWQDSLLAEKALTALIAPCGLAAGSPLLVGLASGEVIRI
jgi:photosystem II stability/assembly factor-like uncharacterized protein